MAASSYVRRRPLRCSVSAAPPPARSAARPRRRGRAAARAAGPAARRPRRARRRSWCPSTVTPARLELLRHARRRPRARPRRSRRRGRPRPRRRAGRRSGRRRRRGRRAPGSAAVTATGREREGAGAEPCARGAGRRGTRRRRRGRGAPPGGPRPARAGSRRARRRPGGSSRPEPEVGGAARRSRPGASRRACVRRRGLVLPARRRRAPAARSARPPAERGERRRRAAQLERRPGGRSVRAGQVGLERAVPGADRAEDDRGGCRRARWAGPRRRPAAGPVGRSCRGHVDVDAEPVAGQQHRGASVLVRRAVRSASGAGPRSARQKATRAKRSGCTASSSTDGRPGVVGRGADGRDLAAGRVDPVDHAGQVGARRDGDGEDLARRRPRSRPGRARCGARPTTRRRRRRPGRRRR